MLFGATYQQLALSSLALSDYYLIHSFSSILLSGGGLKMWLLCSLLLSLLSAVSGAADSKAVTTTLTTKWADTPLLLEARYDTAQL